MSERSGVFPLRPPDRLGWRLKVRKVCRFLHCLGFPEEWHATARQCPASLTWTQRLAPMDMVALCISRHLWQSFRTRTAQLRAKRCSQILQTLLTIQSTTSICAAFTSLTCFWTCFRRTMPICRNLVFLDFATSPWIRPVPSAYVTTMVLLPSCHACQALARKRSCRRSPPCTIYCRLPEDSRLLPTWWSTAWNAFRRVRMCAWAISPRFFWNRSAPLGDSQVVPSFTPLALCFLAEPWLTDMRPDQSLPDTVQWCNTTHVWKYQKWPMIFGLNSIPEQFAKISLYTIKRIVLDWERKKNLSNDWSRQRRRKWTDTTEMYEDICQRKSRRIRLTKALFAQHSRLANKRESEFFSLRNQGLGLTRATKPSELQSFSQLHPSKHVCPEHLELHGIIKLQHSAVSGDSTIPGEYSKLSKSSIWLMHMSAGQNSTLFCVVRWSVFFWVCCCCWGDYLIVTQQHHTGTKTVACNSEFHAKAIITDDCFCVQLWVTGNRLCVRVVLFSMLCEPVCQVHVEHSFWEGGHRSI